MVNYVFELRVGWMELCESLGASRRDFVKEKLFDRSQIVALFDSLEINNLPRNFDQTLTGKFSTSM
jgi:hypothetical protein